MHMQAGRKKCNLVEKRGIHDRPADGQRKAKAGQGQGGNNNNNKDLAS